MNSLATLTQGHRAYARDFQRATPALRAALDRFRGEWEYNRKWGYKQTATLPPLCAEDAQTLLQLARDYYWSAAPVVFGEYEALYRATGEAIRAAIRERAA